MTASAAAPAAAPARVAIIGCGLIGAQWDADGPAAAYSLTHAAGFTKNPGAQLLACCDHDLARAQQAAQRWGAPHAYDDPRRLFAAHAIDIAVVAAASSARWSVIEPALAAGVRVLVIEKPLATTLAESQRLVAAVEAAGARTLVNFSRRWDPAMADLRARIARGELGRVQRLVGTYGKGLSNNGSHMIDLVASLTGAVPLRARALGSPLEQGEADWSSGADTALDVQIEYGGADGDAAGRIFQLTMLGSDQRAFTCFELRVTGTLGMAELSLGGRQLALTGLRADPQYAGYTIPDAPQALPARNLEAMDNMVAEALRLASGAQRSASCDARAALNTALAVAAARRSAERGGAWVELAELAGLTGLAGPA
jgi:predicted dehydrogenase